MKTFGHFVVVVTEITLGVTVGAFVAGYMYEAGRDTYKSDKAATIKEEAKKRVSGWKDILKEKIRQYSR